ncbi:hypothetical protein HZA57_08880, partial [Candidatus Poribacteria bacterium]|nr:hypothetical protein [Candidatus Poribacteria bacterium]
PPMAEPVPPAGPVRPVVLVPPLLNPRQVMSPLAWRLRRAGFPAQIFAYHSYLHDIPQSAQRLAAFLRSLQCESVDIVAYSLGSILMRWAVNHCDMPPVRHAVMLGPPNCGAYMADFLSRKMGPVYPLIYGRCALQLRRGAFGLCARAGLMAPETKLGIIAGGRGVPRGYNPIVPGDNDGTVGVQETVLPGMADFALVPGTHMQLPLQGRTARLVVRFLETGQFRQRTVHVQEEGA